MTHEFKEDLGPIGPLHFHPPTQHGDEEAAWGFTCPHNKKPVQACADCRLSGSVSFGFTSPEATELQTTLFFERKYQLQLTVQHNNPDHKCTAGNPACRKAKAQ